MDYENQRESVSSYLVKNAYILVGGLYIPILLTSAKIEFAKNFFYLYHINYFKLKICANGQP